MRWRTNWHATAWLPILWLLVGCGNNSPLPVSFVVSQDGECAVELSIDGVPCSDSCTATPPAKLQPEPLEGCEPVSIVGNTCDGGSSCLATSTGAVSIRTSRRAWRQVVSISGDVPGTVSVRYGTKTLPCSTGCAWLSPVEVPVELTASAGSGSTFLGFSGTCSSTGNSCRFTPTSVGSTTASFRSADSRRLTVTVSGTGRGELSSVPAGIQCTNDGGVCAFDFPRGQTVVLTGTPSSGSRLGAWTGNACGADPCSVLLDTDANVGLEFVRQVTIQLTSSIPTDGGVWIEGRRYSLPSSAQVDSKASLQISADLPHDQTAVGWARSPCAQQAPLLDCTVSALEDRELELKNYEFVKGISGGWTHFNYRDSLLRNDRLLVLGTIVASTNLTSPAFDPRPHAESALVELSLDGGVSRISMSSTRGDGGQMLTLHSMNSGLVAIGYAPISEGVRLSWGQFDGGSPAPLSSNYFALTFDDQTLEPRSIGFVPASDFHRFGSWRFLERENDTLLATNISVDAKMGASFISLTKDLQTRNRTWSFSGEGLLFRSDPQVVVVSGRAADGGTGLGDCGTASRPEQVLLIRADLDAGCVQSLEIPFTRPEAYTQLSTSTSTPLLSYAQITPGKSEVHYEKLTTAFTSTWKSERLSTKELPSLSIHTMEPLPNGRLLSVVLMADTAGFDVRTSGQGRFRCPSRGATWIQALVVLDEATGKIQWAHCLPGTSPEGSTLDLQRVHVFGNSVALAFTAGPALNRRYSIGRHSSSLESDSTLVMWLSLPP